MKTGLPYFDCFTNIGPRPSMDPGEKYTLEHLLESMDRCGIDCSLVSTPLAASYDVMWVNHWLSKQLAPHKRLFPLWTASSNYSEDMPTVSTFLREAQRNNVRAVRIAPKSSQYGIERHTIGKLMDGLADAKLPVFVHKNEIGQETFKNQLPVFERIERLFSTYKKNKFVMLGMHWQDWRFVLPLLEKYQNWSMELSVFQSNLAPEILVSRFGSKRFIFGGDAPQKSQGAARALIDWAEIPLRDREAISHRNLMGLLKMKELPSVVKKPADDIVAACWLGKPLDMIEVLDPHAHINHSGCNGTGALTQLGSGPSEMRHLFNRIGIQKVSVSAWLSIMGLLQHEGNDITYAAMQKEPDFFIGYAVLDAGIQTREEMEKEIDLRYRKQGFVGLKPYIHSTARFGDERFAVWYEYANKHRLFALFHHEHGTAAELTKKYPHVSFLLAHTGESIARANSSSSIALPHKNLYCEITLTAVTNGAIELMVKKLGSRRVLFGTDAPMRDPRQQLGWALHADISREAKVDVLGANFKRILARCRPATWL